MCTFCTTTNIPVCAIDGSCGTGFNQNLHMAMLMAGPTIGGAVYWVRSKYNLGKNKIFKKSSASGSSKYIIKNKKPH